MNQLAVMPNEAQQLPATLDRIESAIALASNPEEINKVLALMDAAVAYAKRFYKDQQDVIQRAKTLRLQAERKLGELLRDMPKNSGAKGNPGGHGAKLVRSNDDTAHVPTLAEIGIDKSFASRAQRLAALPEKKFQAVVSGEISLTRAIAAPPKKSTAKTRAADAIQQHKDVAATEGSTYLITTMRSAFNALESAGSEIDELDKAIVIAKKLLMKLAQFIDAHQGDSDSL